MFSPAEKVYALIGPARVSLLPSGNGCNGLAGAAAIT